MKILTAVDFSAVTGRVLEHTKVLANALGAEVTLVHVADPEPEFVGYEPGPPSVRHDAAKEFRQEHRQIQELAGILRGEGIKTMPLLVQGVTVDAILEEAERLDADMIIIGSHGHGAVYHLIMGSVGEGVVKGAKCPVLVVPTDRE